MYTSRTVDIRFGDFKATCAEMKTDEGDFAPFQFEVAGKRFDYFEFLAILRTADPNAYEIIVTLGKSKFLKTVAAFRQRQVGKLDDDFYPTLADAANAIGGWGGKVW